MINFMFLFHIDYCHVFKILLSCVLVLSRENDERKIIIIFN